MNLGRAKINDLINKLRAYCGEEEYLSSDEIRLFTSWLKANPSSELTADLLYALQTYGINERKKAQWFNTAVFECFKITTDADIACLCLYNLSDSIYYTETIDPKDILYIIEEDRDFNLESRAYKLAKSDFLSKVLAINSYKDIWIKVSNWIKTVFTNNDGEYIDLLAFALTNNEVVASADVSADFKDYLQLNPMAEASEEILKLLTSS